MCYRIGNRNRIAVIWPEPEPEPEPTGLAGSCRIFQKVTFPWLINVMKVEIWQIGEIFLIWKKNIKILASKLRKF